MKKKYSVKLDGEYIGFTFLEGADASMGGVQGKLFFEGIESGYDFISSFCKKENIPVNSDAPEEKFITTQSFNQTTDRLRVYNSDGVEIKGVGFCINGFEDDFEIDIFGVPYPFYEREFPHHCKR
jgi:hypothetical protein